MMFSSSNKLTHIINEIDIARCKGHWKSIPDLARRYKKYNPDGSALENIILAEASFIDLYRVSPPNPKQVQHIESQLETILQQYTIKDVELQDSAKIILSRVYFENKKYDAALLLLDNLVLDKNSTGYKFILHYQSMAIKALCLEMIGDMESCLETYEYISTLLDDKPVIKDATLIEWAEETLYHANLLLYKNNFSFSIDTTYKLNIFRSYHKATYYQSFSKFLHHRMEVTMLFIKYISYLYRNGEYLLPTDATISINADGYNDTEYEKRYFIDEITQLYTVYESMLYHSLSHPSSPSSSKLSTNDILYDFVNLMAGDLDIILETTDDLYGFKEFIERVAEKAFNSPNLSRHLFSVLVQLGELDEAQHVLQSYLQSCGHMTFEWHEKCKDGNSIIQDSQGELITEPYIQHFENNISSPSPSNNNNNKTNNDNDNIYMDGKDIYESIKNQLNVLLIAIEMYCKDLSKPSQAVEMAELALNIAKNHLSIVQDYYMSKIYDAAGISYGLLASQVVDKVKRPYYYEKSISLLQKSIELAASDAWEPYYHLAYQYAEMGNIDLGIQYIRKSLEIESDYISSWHLLALLLSCPSQNNIIKAIEVATIGLQLADESNNNNILVDQHEQFLALKLTQIKLHHLQNGSEVAIKELLAFFNQYGKWIGSELDIERFDLLYNGSHPNEKEPSSWFSQLLYNSFKKRNTLPRSLILRYSYDNINTLSSPTTPSSSSSSSFTTINLQINNTPFQNRSVSSNTISFHQHNHNNNDHSGTYAKSVLTVKSDNQNHHQPYSSSTTTTTTTTTTTILTSTTTASSISSNLAKRASTLRKHASNSMLGLGNTDNMNSNYNNNHSHWQGMRLFPSRSASKYSAKQLDLNNGDENTTFPVFVNTSKSNDSFNKKSILSNDKSLSVHNSNQSMHNGSVKGTPSIYSSTSGSPTASLSQLFPTILTPRKTQYHRYDYITTKQYIQYQKHKKFLCELWILSAKWFKELNQWDEMMKAIFEAELISPELPDVWCFLGELKLIHKEDHPHAIRLFRKGLLLEPHHIGCQIGLAKVHLEIKRKEKNYDDDLNYDDESDQIDIAEGILTSVIQGSGWKSIEAWYLLGQLFSKQPNHLEQAKHHLLYALDLEMAHPIQPFSILSTF
ncbi:unnamed protein product [Cunninghamella blakesleeana]